jgi:hypothetical protein
VAGSTSTPSTIPRSTTSTFDLESFTMADIALGEPLQWGQVMAIDDGYPLSLTEHAGSWFLFSNESDGGLRAWRSGTGVDWEPLGQVIGVEHTFDTGVVSDGNELMALATGENRSGSVLWRSDDGTDWHMTQIELVSGDGSTEVFPHAIGGNGEIYLISGSGGSTPDPVYERLAAAVGDLVDLDDYGWSTDVVGEEITFIVYGPLGIPLVTMSADEVGLTSPEREQIIRDYSGVRQTAHMWRSTDGVAWEETEIEEVEWIDSIASTPDGRLLAFGYQPFSGARIYRSPDGIDWEISSDVLQPYSVQKWGDLLVGIGGGVEPSVMVSADADLWEDIRPADVFPRSISWQMDVLGAGPGGIAAQVTGWADGPMPDPGEPVILVADNGYELSLDFNAAIRLTSPDGEDQVWSTTGLTEKHAHADLATGEMVFTNQETGEEVARFDLEELMAAENEYWSNQDSGPTYNALVFTPDGSSWTIQDLQEVAVDSYLQWLEVTNEHVVAVKVADAFDPDSDGGFEVWAAEIP